MKTVTNNWKKRIVGMALAGAAVAGPLLAVGTAQADPDNRGRRDNNGRWHQDGRRDGGRRGNDDRRGNGRWDYNQRSFSGTVGAIVGDRQFYLNLDSGGSLRVDASGQRRYLNTGTRVTVHGSFSSDRGRFIANNFSGTGGGGNGRHRR